MKRTTQVSFVVFVLLAYHAAFAQEYDRIVEIRPLEGTVSAAGNSADILIEINNHSGVTVRLVALSMDYDASSGTVLTFTAPSSLDVTVAPETADQQWIRFDTLDARNEFFQWTTPYSVDLALGANVDELATAVENSGDELERVRQALRDITELASIVRRSERFFEGRINTIEDAEAWFDFELVNSLTGGLEDALCRSLGRQITRAGGADDRVDMYYDVSEELINNELYPSCLPFDVRLSVARDMITEGRGQDALVLCEYDNEGEVAEAWRAIYIEGRVGLAENAIPAEVMSQFRPGIQSLNEVRRLAPDHEQLESIANQLLAGAATRITLWVEEEQEFVALELVEMMREQWADHPQVERAAATAAGALPGLVERALSRNRPTLANNAYVLGLRALDGVPAWEVVWPDLQRARVTYFFDIAEQAIEEGDIEVAEEALDDARQVTNIEINRGTMRRIEGELLSVKWAGIYEDIEAELFESAMMRAQRLEEEAHDITILGDERGAAYLAIAIGIWEKHGLMAGVASRTRIGLAEEAIELGRESDPELADSLSSKFFYAKWTFPFLLGFILAVAGLVIALKGSWRKRRKAKRYWKQGQRFARMGNNRKASAFLTAAYELLETDAAGAEIVGESTRGHLVLAIAQVEKARKRKDKLKSWQSEWKVLEDWERPYSQDFDEALEKASE